MPGKARMMDPLIDKLGQAPAPADMVIVMVFALYTVRTFLNITLSQESEVSVQEIYAARRIETHLHKLL